jgi:hypothetical protein
MAVMSYITVCPACGGCYEEQSQAEADNPNRLCTQCWRSRTQAGSTYKEPPSAAELMDRGFVYPNAGVVLHQILAALYRDGPDTEWNSDMWQTVAAILDSASLTYEHWSETALESE